MLKKIFLYLSLLILIAVGTKNFIYAYLNFSGYGTHDDCGLSEWLINYQGGFARRGIAGEIFFYISKISLIPANYLWLAITCFSYLYLLIYFVKKTKNQFKLELIISAILLGMPIYTNFFWKKDVFQILLFLLGLIIFKKKLNSFLKITLINLICIFGLLNHESFMFYAVPPLFFLSLSLWNEKQSIILKIFKSSLSFAFIFFTFFILFYISLSLTDESLSKKAFLILHSWDALWLKVEGKIPTDLSCFTFLSHIDINTTISRFGFFTLFWFALILICFYSFINFSIRLNLNKKINLIKILLSQLIFLFPLFYTAGDWSRWIFFWTASSLLIYLEVHNYYLYNFRFFDSFLRKILNSKIFNFKSETWPLLFLGFPYVDYYIRIFRDYMWVTPIGKLLAGVYKLFVWMIKIVSGH